MVGSSEPLLQEPPLDGGGWQRSFDGTLLSVEASALAVEEGSPRLAGTILMGAAAALLPLSRADWEAAVRRRFSAAEVSNQNLKAFQRGWEYAQSLSLKPRV